MTKEIKFLLLFIASFGSLWAQQVPMMGNAHIIEYRKKMVKNGIPSANRTQSTSTALALPFYDEFSNAGPYPDENKWQNSQSVYVNRTKAIAPPTLGIATFDGLNKYGYPYNDNQTIACGNYGNSLGNYPSDTLMSSDIRLDSIPASFQSLSPSDSVYLSFYYQAQGYFEAPETNDALMLEFYSPNDSLWNFVWGHSGYVLTDSAWHLVMIPIKDTSYFKKDFKFRFRNLSSASGDVDHWHIDVVYLDKIRNYKDTIFGDFTFSYDLPSPLKNYTQMPYKQYAGAADLKTNISGVALRNNYNDIGHETVDTYYKFYDKNENLLDSVYTGSMNLQYFGTVGFCSNANMISPTLNYSYPMLSQPDTFLMKFNITSHSSDHSIVNDTIKFHQYFSNYYAYDDGSAEAGFGICGDKLAVKYKVNVADTLRAMDIFFDPIYNLKTLETTSFKLAVWPDNGGQPAVSTMYTDAVDRYPYFPADTVVPGTQRVNSFLRYQLQQPVALTAGTTFYIGIIPNSYNPLAIGFDRNTNFYQNMFRYTYTGGPNNQQAWYVFPAAAIPDYKGSLMIRPVLGDSASTVSIKDYQVKTNDLKIYPNPANNNIQVSMNNEQITEIKLYNMLGSEVQSLKLNAPSSSTQIDLSNLENGMYFVKVLSDKGYMSSQKLMISK